MSLFCKRKIIDSQNRLLKILGECSIFLSMSDSSKNKPFAIDVEVPADVAMNRATAGGSARIKRMRGWLGVKSTSSLGGYDDEGGGVAYGDGHSGWNR